MIDIKFRQPLFDIEGEFIEFHYWGFIDDQFIEPATYLKASQRGLKKEQQQYTGIKDKNGVEIYEGDILRVHFSTRYGVDSQEEVYNNKIVTFNQTNAAFALCSGELISSMYKSLSEKSEVIGNIHENPELINKQ